tara:strand:- start:376 stop:558 length:183 start_codon:yes stop_codon:yes gene_type:complete
MKTKITKQELQELYLHNKNDFICRKLGISITTLLSYLDKFGIGKKGKGNRQAKAKVVVMD